MRKFSFFVALAMVLCVMQGAFALNLPAFRPIRIIVTGRSDAAIYDFLPPPGGGVPYTDSGAAAVDGRTQFGPVNAFSTRLGGAGREDSWGIFQVALIEDALTGDDYFGGSAGTGGKEIVGVFYDLQDIYVQTALDSLDPSITIEHIDSEGGFVVFYEQNAGVSSGAFATSPTLRTVRHQFPGIGDHASSTVLWTTQFTDAGFLHTVGQFGGPTTSLDDTLRITNSGLNAGRIESGSSSNSGLTLATIPIGGGGFITGSQQNLIQVGSLFRNSVQTDFSGAPGSTPIASPGVTISDPTVPGAPSPNWTTVFTGTFVAFTTPEPSTIVLVGMGLIGLAAAMRKRCAK